MSAGSSHRASAGAFPFPSIEAQRLALKREVFTSPWIWRILVLGAWRLDQVDRASCLIRALENLGHAVLSIDAAKQNLCRETTGRVKDGGPGFLDTEQLAPYLERFKPELVVIIGGGLRLTEEDARGFKEQGRLLVGLTLSESGVEDPPPDQVRYFDLYGTSGLASVKQYQAAGLENAVLFPFGVDRGFACTDVPPTPEFSANIVCVGNAVDRPDLIRRMQRLSDTFEGVRAYGQGWEGAGVGLQAGLHHMQAMRSGSIHVHCPDTESGPTGSTRDELETVASGAVLATKRVKESPSPFDYDTEIIRYADTDDLLAQINSLLGDPQRVESMRRAAFARLAKGHLYEHLWLAFLGELQARISTKNADGSAERTAPISASNANQRKRRIVLSGFYGAGNGGDELILRSIIEHIARPEDPYHVVVAAYDADAVTRTHAASAFPRTDLVRGQSEVAAATAFVLGGGGLWHDYTFAGVGGLLSLFTDHLSAVTGYSKLPLLAKIYSRPLHVYGIGVGPMTDPDAMAYTRFVSRLATSLGVRDGASKDLLETIDDWDLDVGVYPDPVFALNLDNLPKLPADLGTRLKERRVLGVNLRPWAQPPDPEFLARTTAVLRAIAIQQGCVLLGIPLQSPQDTEVLERVFGALPAEVERHILQPFETSDLMSIPAGIAACDALFGMRYHACLLALRLGVPTVGIAYDPKVSALFDQAGIPELALEMGAPEDLVLRTLRGVLEDRAVWHDRVGPTVARLEADASKGFAALRSGLDQASTVTTPLIANASLSPSREREALAQKLSQAKYQLISLSQDDSDAMDQTSAVQKDHIPSHIKTSELLKELKELRASYDQIIYSKSWFVTKPLRWSVRKASAGWRVLRRRLPNLSLPRRASTAMPLDGASAQGKGARLSPNTRELPARLSELRIGVIMDTFTHSCFSEECELISFRPDNWEEVLTHNPPDFLFVESAWHGNDGSWQYRVAEYPAPPGRELPALVAWCKRYGIPTVFWNKEDPPHFDEFLSAAKLFDVVFTSDANCIRKYKKYCGHDRVYPLAFAAQPKIHNPVVTQPRNNKLCFAGSYYADRFDARKKGMETLLKPALKFEFDIFDRMYGAVGPGTEAYRFPQAYMPHIVGRLPYDEMIDAYKRYRVFLNVNSVTDSPTMFSRRVFEILACGTPVVSTDSVGIRRFFPDIVPLVSKPNQATDAFHDLLSDDYQWRRLSALGVRTVMSYHTYQHRLRTICERLGFQMETDAAVQVTVVVFPGLDALKTARQIMAQRISPTNILIRRSNHADELMSALWAEGFHCPVEINEDPRSCVDQTETAVVVFVDGHCSYGPGYIQDALLALSFSGVSATGMSEYFCLSAGEVEMRSDFGPSGLLCGRVHRGTLVCRATQSTAVMFDNLADKDEVLLGNPCYARAPFEFLAGAVLQQEDAAWQRIVLPEISDVQDC